MTVTLFRARILLRNNAVATVALAVIAGLAAAVPIAGWAAARQTFSALPNFLERSDPPDVAVFFCPAEIGDLTDVDPNSAEGQAVQDACRRYDQQAEHDQLAAMPEVASTTRMTAVVGRADLGAGPELLLVSALLDPVLPPPVGPGELIKGRWFDNSHADELLISETMAKLRPSMGVGATVSFTPYLLSQNCAGEGSCAPEGDSVDLTIVGVVREVADLAPPAENGQNADDGGTLYLPSAWWDQYGASDPFRYGTGNLVWAAPGVSAPALQAAIEARFPGRAQFESPLPAEVTTLADAIAYEARAAEFVALLTAIAAVMFVGQAILRQASKEADDLHILAALGGGRRMTVSTALLRNAVIAVGAAVVAAVAAFMLSPVGPVGVARRVQPGAHTLDVPIVFIGLGVLVTVICMLGVTPAWLAYRHHNKHGADPSRIGAWAAGVLGPPAATGVAAALAHQQRGRSALRSAIVATSCAVAGIVAAATLTSSLSSVLNSPADFGVTWDVAVGNIDSTEGEEAAGVAVAAIPGISAAVGIYDASATVDGKFFPLVGFVPVAGMDDFDPAIVAGRAPTRPGEVALGHNTMSKLGLAIGDEFVFTLESPNDDVLTATVVGEALLNNTFSLEAGTGAIIDPEWIRSLTGGQPQQLAVKISADADRARVLAALNEAFPNTVVSPTPPTGLRNLARIDGIPGLLALVVGALAFAALAHALTVSIRRRRLEFAILRSLGFTRRQVIASARWQAITIGVTSLTLGIPLGLLLGSWSWRLLSSNIGLSAAPVSNGWVLIIASVGAIVVTTLLSILPGRRAVCIAPSVALRSAD